MAILDPFPFPFPSTLSIWLGSPFTKDQLQAEKATVATREQVTHTVLDRDSMKMCPRSFNGHAKLERMDWSYGIHGLSMEYNGFQWPCNWNLNLIGATYIYEA